MLGIIAGAAITSTVFTGLKFLFDVWQGVSSYTNAKEQIDLARENLELAKTNFAIGLETETLGAIDTVISNAIGQRSTAATLQKEAEDQLKGIDEWIEDYPTYKAGKQDIAWTNYNEFLDTWKNQYKTLTQNIEDTRRNLPGALQAVDIDIAKLNINTAIGLGELQAKERGYREAGEEQLRDLFNTLGYGEALAGATGRFGAGTSMSRVMQRAYANIEAFTGKDLSLEGYDGSYGLTLLDIKREIWGLVGEDEIMDETGGTYAEDLMGYKNKRKGLEEDANISISRWIEELVEKFGEDRSMEGDDGEFGTARRAAEFTRNRDLAEPMKEMTANILTKGNLKTSIYGDKEGNIEGFAKTVERLSGVIKAAEESKTQIQLIVDVLNGKVPVPGTETNNNGSDSLSDALYGGIQDAAGSVADSIANIFSFGRIKPKNEEEAAKEAKKDAAWEWAMDYIRNRGNSAAWESIIRNVTKNGS